MGNQFRFFLAFFWIFLFCFSGSNALAEILVRDLPDQLKQLHPHHFSGSPEAQVLKDTYEGLVVQDQNGEPVPGMASDIEISPDRMTYRFRIRDDARWSDGSQITAEDFVRSFKTLADPNTGATYRWYLRVGQIKGADAALAGDIDALGVKVENNELVLELQKPAPYILGLLTFPSFLPVAAGNDSEQPVSNGPYYIVSQKDDAIRIKKNSYYYQKDKLSAEEVLYKVQKNQDEELEEYNKGLVDITARLKASSEQLARSEGLTRLVEHQILATTMLLPNMSYPMLANLDFRKALSLALDRNALVHSNYPQGKTRPACSLTAPLTHGFSPDEDNCERLLKASDRIKQAQMHLKRSGYSPEKIKLKVTSSMKFGTDDVLRQMAEQWKSVLGIEVSIVALSWRDFVTALNNKDYELMVFSWLAGYNDTTAFLQPVMEEVAFGAFSDQDYQTQLEQAAQKNTMAERQPFYHKAERILAMKLPIIPVLHPTFVHLVKPDIKGYYTSNPEGWVHSRYLHLAR